MITTTKVQIHSFAHGYLPHMSRFSASMAHQAQSLPHRYGLGASFHVTACKGDNPGDPAPFRHLQMSRLLCLFSLLDMLAMLGGGFKNELVSLFCVPTLPHLGPPM